MVAIVAVAAGVLVDYLNDLICDYGNLEGVARSLEPLCKLKSECV